MSSKFIVKQPIKDAQGRILGNEILYYGENQAFAAENSNSDFEAADTIYHFLMENTNKVLSGSINFMTFTTTLLMKKTPRLFEKSELVLQIDDSVIIHPLAMHMVQQYQKEGYKIAVNEFQFAPRYLAILDDIDYVKLNFQSTSESTLDNIIEIVHSLGKKCIAVAIDNETLYQKALNMNVDAFQGAYVAEQMHIKTHSAGYIRSNFFRLMVEVTREEPDVEEIERLIAMDVSLTFGLLKMANSVYFALQHRATSIHQAVMTLGLSQLKQWVYLLSAANGDEDILPESEEFLKRSFMRANFCSDLVNYASNVPLNKSDAYLMGMFSTLPYLIDAPFEEILSEIPVPDVTKEALLHHAGRAGLMYDLVLSYERADWEMITKQADELGVPANQLTNIYFDCMERVNASWKQLTDAAEGASAAGSPK